MNNEARFRRDVEAYHARQGSRFRLEDGLVLREPMYDDHEDPERIMPTHYFEQDIWAAKKVIAKRPTRHVDIGSRVDGFVSHLLAASIPVEFVDIRPLPRLVEGLTFRQADATNLDGIPDNSVESLSSLHAVEHMGLGRYGDPIDPDGWEKALRAMVRVLAPGGYLYLSVPVGREMPVFHAHRIFDPSTVRETLADLRLTDFAWIGDDKFLRASKPPTYGCDEARKCSYGCGMFAFVKGEVL